MGFEAPLYLLGLAAAALPVVAHLIRKRRLPTVALPTISLLLAAEARSRRRRRLVDVVLLACRIALIALVALAIAKPFREVPLAYGDGRPAAVAIVIDDSMSMGQTVSGDRLFEIAIERARGAVSSLPEGSEVALILGGSPARVAVPLGQDRARVGGTLSKLTVTGRSTDLTQAITLAVRELGRASLGSRRLLVLTDGAMHGALESPVAAPREVAVQVEVLGDDEPRPNFAITEAVSAPDPTTPGQSSLAFTVQGFGGAEGRVPVKMLRGQARLTETIVEVKDGSGRGVVHIPDQADEAEPGARLVLEIDDALELDDTRWVLLREPVATRLLLVDGDPHPRRDDDEVGYLTRALDHAPRNDSPIVYRTIDAASLDAAELTESDAVILANARAPSASDARRLVTFVENGGGLLIAPGHHYDARVYAGLFGQLLPAAARAPVDARPEAEMVSASAEFLPEGLEGTLALVRRRILLEEPTQAETQVPLRYADGLPALVLGSYGAGMVALLSTTVDDDWSDLPLRPVFLPLMARLAHHLSPRRSMPTVPFEAGRPVALPVDGPSRVRVLNPRRGDVEVTEHDGRVLVKATDVPGAYRVDVRDRDGAYRPEPALTFLTAPASAESDLTTKATGLATRGTKAADERATVQQPIGDWLLLLAGLLALLEGFLRLTGKRWSVTIPAFARSR